MRIGPSGSGFNELPLPPERALPRPAESLPVPADGPTGERRERVPQTVPPSAEVERLRDRAQGQGPSAESALTAGSRRALAAYRDAAGNPAREELDRLLGLDLYA